MIILESLFNYSSFIGIIKIILKIIYYIFEPIISQFMCISIYYFDTISMPQDLMHYQSLGHLVII